VNIDYLDGAGEYLGYYKAALRVGDMKLVWNEKNITSFHNSNTYDSVDNHIDVMPSSGRITALYNITADPHEQVLLLLLLLLLVFFVFVCCCSCCWRCCECDGDATDVSLSLLPLFIHSLIRLCVCLPVCVYGCSHSTTTTTTISHEQQQQ